ncbi:MAG: TonB-dependent receptor [Burkholderiales bacterium]|nr:TonB-dependent receptor [Burkholderiales bacterium]
MIKIALGRHVACVFVGAAGAMASLVSWAQSAAPAAEANEARALAPVVISATRSIQPLEGLPVSASVFTRDEVQAVAGQTIDEILRGVAGVQLPGESASAVFPLNPSIAMRGLGVGDTATRALVLVDGLPINGGFFGNVFWNRAPKATIERVEVVRGASSSLFGSNAMGGVVNIVSRAPQRGGVAELQYAQQDTRQASLSYGADVNEAAALGLSLNYMDTDGYFASPPRLYRPVNERLSGNLLNLQLRGDFKFSPTVRAFVKLGHNDQERVGGTRLSRADTRVSDLAVGVDMDLGKRTTLSLRSFYARENFDTDGVSVPNPATSFVSNRHRTHSDDAGLSAQWSRLFGGVLSRLSVGFDGRRIDGKDDQDVFNTPGVATGRIVGEGRQLSLGLFGEAGFAPTDRLEMSTSLRVDYFRDEDGRIVNNGTAQNFASQAFTKLSPRVAARYQLAEPVALRGAAFKGFRAPTLAERYRSFETPTFRGRSNPDLSEERLTGADAGVDLKFGRASGQVNYFYNELKDFIGSEFAGFSAGKVNFEAANIAQVRSQGVELTGDVPLARALNLKLNYTYTDAKVTKGDLKGNRSEGTPRNMASATLAYGAAGATRWNLRGRWLDKSFQDISNESPQDAHFVVDGSVAVRLRSDVDLLASVTNLFNERYVASGFSQTVGAPRQIALGLRAKF